MAQHDDSEARLAAVVASSLDAIISKDLNGVIQTWNRGAEQMFGYTAEEAIGQSITMLIPVERLAEEHDVLSRVCAGLTVESFETVRKHKNGRLIDISLTVSPVRTSDGEIIGASKIARDITEQRRLRVLAEDASRLKDEFLAVLSHELRTPLNTVLGYARMLRREDKRMTEELRERALVALERNADLLNRLVGDVLDTSRIVTGKLRLTLETCDLDEVVEEAVETIAPSADAKGVSVRTHLDRDIPVLADPVRLQQVIWNLLSNAVKFTPSGGTITVRARQQVGTVAISVEDSGIGIAEEHQPHVFQRFWQAHTGVSREFAGLGIGLALARHIVELHGGTISVESAGVGRGAMFTVTLPAAARRGP